MGICGVKAKKSGNDVYLSLVEKRVYDEQVGTVVVVDEQGKQVGELIDIFDDGSIHFVEGNSEKLGLKLDSSGRLKCVVQNNHKVTPSKKLLTKGKVTKGKEEKFKTYPIVRVVESTCMGAKAGCQHPLTIALRFDTTQCPPKSRIIMKNYYNGSDISSLFEIDNTGKVFLYESIPNGYGLDLTGSYAIKVRGDLPESP